MLSYQHGFHAGNFADLHKHLVLFLVLRALNRKEKPWSYFETHAGRGLYELNSDQALKTAEYREGVGRIWEQSFHAELNLFLEQIKLANPTSALTHYPGSPKLAAQMARDKDRLHLMELHPQEIEQLRRTFRSFPQVGVHHRDGYEGVYSLLPPKPNRGLVLIDPAYEVKTEYQQVVGFVNKAVTRWPNGIFAVWYPMLSADRWRSLIESISAIKEVTQLLDSKLHVAEPKERGMYGSGMLLINPPWQLDQQLDMLLPELLSALAPESGSIELSWLKQQT